MHRYESTRQIPNDRLIWEEKNRDEFEADFEHTQKAGSEEFGMAFVKAQESAIAAFGGIFRRFDPQDFYTKALLSRTVLSALRAVRKLNPK